MVLYIGMVLTEAVLWYRYCFYPGWTRPSTVFLALLLFLLAGALQVDVYR